MPGMHGTPELLFGVVQSLHETNNTIMVHTISWSCLVKGFLGGGCQKPYRLCFGFASLELHVSLVTPKTTKVVVPACSSWLHNRANLMSLI